MKDAFISLPSLGVCALIFLFTADRGTANLVANGDFETGDLNSWTFTNAHPARKKVAAKTVPPPHHGTRGGAAMGATDTTPDVISEALATIPATAYDLAFLYQVGFADNSAADNKSDALSTGLSVPQSNLNAGAGTSSNTGMIGPGNLTALALPRRNALSDSNSRTATDLPKPVVAVASPVPDAGSSALLLMLSVIALAGFERIRARRHRVA